MQVERTPNVKKNTGNSKLLSPKIILNKATPRSLHNVSEKKGIKRSRKALLSETEISDSGSSDDDSFIVTERKYPLRNKRGGEKRCKSDVIEEESTRNSSTETESSDTSDESSSEASDGNDEDFDIQKFKDSLKEKPSLLAKKCQKRVKNDFPEFLDKQRKRFCQQDSKKPNEVKAAALQENHRWTPRRKKALVNIFGDYLSGEKSHTFPPLQHMERFVQEMNLDIPAVKVKEKIMNEKARLKREIKKRKKALSMDHLE